MRGILSFGRSIINEVREFGFGGAVANLRHDASNAIGNVFAVHWHADGVQQGVALYFRIPNTCPSTLVEWHDISHGRGIERTDDGFNIYLGRLQVNLCREQGQMYRSAL
jgi:hypothetical protein